MPRKKTSKKKPTKIAGKKKAGARPAAKRKAATKRKQERTKAPAKAPAQKPPAPAKGKPPRPMERAAPAKVEVTNDLRRIWLRVRSTWNMSLQAFGNALTLLSDKEANMLYDLVRHSLFKGSYAEIIREHPELREFLHNDEDRLCMHDIYEQLSWRLRRREPFPKAVELKERMKGRIGRDSGAYEY